MLWSSHGAVCQSLTASSALNGSHCSMLRKIAPPCSSQSQSNFIGFREGCGFKGALTLCGVLYSSNLHKRDHSKRDFQPFTVNNYKTTDAFINSSVIFHSAISHCLPQAVLFISFCSILFLNSPIYSFFFFTPPVRSFFLQTSFSVPPPSILPFFPSYPQMFFCVCLASNPPNPSWASFMKMQIHSRAGKNVNRRKFPCSTNQKRRTIKNRQQQPGDPNSVQPPPEIATHACINPLQAKNMWLKELCCHLLLGTTSATGKVYLSPFPHSVWCLKSDSHLLNIAFDI